MGELSRDARGEVVLLLAALTLVWPKVDQGLVFLEIFSDVSTALKESKSSQHSTTSVT